MGVLSIYAPNRKDWYTEDAPMVYTFDGTVTNAERLTEDFCRRILANDDLLFCFDPMYTVIYFAKYNLNIPSYHSVQYADFVLTGEKRTLHEIVQENFPGAPESDYVKAIPFVINNLYEKMYNAKVLDIYDTHKKLLQILANMRIGGIAVDFVKLEKMKKDAGEKCESLKKKIESATGMKKLNVNQESCIREVLELRGIKYDGESLDAHILRFFGDPVLDMIVELREQTKIKNTYLKNFEKLSVNGRLHCIFDPIGARSGRFSCKEPNLQNIPQSLRSVFLPDEGCQWYSFDYSQIEYRLLAHYAYGDNAERMRWAYKGDKDADFHALATKLIKVTTGATLTRKEAKSINFGMVYGMGTATLCKKLGDNAGALLDAYNRAFPCIKKTSGMIEGDIKNGKGLCTIANRKLPLSRDEAYKGLNYLLQGSASDILKIAMARGMDNGVFDVYRPQLTIHDELTFSIPAEEPREAIRLIEKTMVEAVELKVPLKVTIKHGPDWGELMEV